MSISRELKRDGVYIVSEGTMRPEDLAHKFLTAMEDVDVPDGIILYHRRDFENEQEQNSPDLDDVVFVEMWGTLEDYAPDGFYFGTPDGDGACYGFFEVADV